MGEVVGSIMVPCSADSKLAIEALFDGVSSAFANSEHSMMALSVASMEGAQFVLSQPPAQGVATVLSCTILNLANTPVVEFGYPGEGLTINGVRPPYPHYVVGLTFLMARAVGVKLYARVESRESALMFLREPGLPISPPTPGGPLSEEDHEFRRMMAIIALCRYWKDVRCIRQTGERSLLRLENPFVALPPSDLPS